MLTDSVASFNGLLEHEKAMQARRQERAAALEEERASAVAAGVFTARPIPTKAMAQAAAEAAAVQEKERQVAPRVCLSCRVCSGSCCSGCCRVYAALFAARPRSHRF